MNEAIQNYEMRWYATFYDEHGQQLDRVTLGPGKMPIPLLAMYMTADAEVRARDEAGCVCPKCGTTGCLEDKASGF